MVCYVVTTEETQRNISDGTKRVPTLCTDGAAHPTATDDQVITVLHIVHGTSQEVTRNAWGEKKGVKNSECTFTFLSFCGLLFHQCLAKIKHRLASAHVLLSSKSGKPKLKLNTSKPVQNILKLLIPGILLNFHL